MLFLLLLSYSLSKDSFDGTDSLENPDEKSPLLSAHSIGAKGTVQSEDVKVEEKEPERERVKDFQTIRVPGSGGTAPVRHLGNVVHYLRLVLVVSMLVQLLHVVTVSLGATERNVMIYMYMCVCKSVNM